MFSDYMISIPNSFPNSSCCSMSFNKCNYGCTLLYFPVFLSIALGFSGLVVVQLITPYFLFFPSAYMGI